ncbi:MAG: carbohydrate-binding domain-containing protein, partial [Firmicutes bacterium]|nr:carbohydrate-binding domain-containing protein [Bacillota bacterium]
MKMINKSKALAIFAAASMIASMTTIPALAASAEYSEEGATEFEFTDSAITVEDGDYTEYEIDSTDLIITGSGTYIISGTCTDGSITVKKGATGVTLVLDGLTLTSEDTAPVTCNKSTEVKIVAASGSVNNLADSEYNNEDNYPENENAENAVIKTKDGSDVTICGTGAINITANGKNGIKGGATTDEEGEASLTVKDLTLSIESTEDGLKSDQELNILSGNITVTAADDAVKSDLVLNIGAEGKTGPSITVKSDNEGVEAANINIYSGNINVTAVDDGINAANKDLTDYEYSCNIYGGTIYIDSGADAIDSNGTLTISGGTIIAFSSSSGDNSPLDSDGEFTLTGGTVLAVGAGQMSQTPNSASQVYVTFGAGGMFGRGMNGMRNENGDFTPPEGKTLPDGELPEGMTPPEGMPERPEEMTPPDGENFGGRMGKMRNADGDFTPPDGELPEGITPPGEMNSGEGASSVSISAGDTITVLDASGNTLISEKALRTASYVFYTSDELVEGETYILKINGSEAATAAASAQGGGMPGNAKGGTQNPQNPSGSASNSGASESEGSSKFDDVKTSSWYYKAVDFASEKGLMSDMTDKRFEPQTSASRAMVAAILYRLAGSPEVEYKALFSDIAEGKWYSDAVIWAAENGIVSGFSDGTFGPNKSITREELASMLHRYALKTGDKSEGADLMDFNDSKKVSSWAEESMKWAVGEELINGDENKNLNPKSNATRAEFAQIL